MNDYILWEKVKALRDGEDTAQAVRLFKRPDNHVPVVPEAEIPDLIRTLLIALSIDKQKPPAGFGSDGDARTQLSALA